VSTPSHASAARSLILLRHAKSSWATPGLADRDRPLNARGARDAVAVAAALAALPTPDRVLCSSALRTRQTLAALQAAGALQGVTVEVDDALYLASATAIERRIGAAGSGPHLLLIGHNPGIEELAQRLAGQPITMKTSSFCHFERAAADGWTFEAQATPRGVA